MINTPAFESLERYLRLKRAIDGINGTGAYIQYVWMQEALWLAIAREESFVESNKEAWEKELYPERKL